MAYYYFSAANLLLFFVVVCVQFVDRNTYKFITHVAVVDLLVVICNAVNSLLFVMHTIAGAELE